MTKKRRRRKRRKKKRREMRKRRRRKMEVKTTKTNHPFLHPEASPKKAACQITTTRKHPTLRLLLRSPYPRSNNSRYGGRNKCKLLFLPDERSKMGHNSPIYDECQTQ